MPLYRHLPERYNCLYIDITWSSIISAYSSIVSSPERKQLQTQVEGLFGGYDNCIACTSVRSALDLFLCTMNFPRGSEIIFTAVNIPDMSTIVEEHGINIISVDIDLETLSPKEELLELAITDKTVAILAAHTYGKWINMDMIITIARAHNLFVLEDCAECFHGFDMKGHLLSDLVFFSFGLIKYYTCFGGAVVQVRNKELLQKMRLKLGSYPVQSHSLFFKKLLKYSFLTFLTNSSTLAWLFIPLFHYVGFDYKEFFISMLRGYPGQIMKQLRFQPSAPLLKIMLDRLSNVNNGDFQVIKMKGDFVRDHLPENVFVPGQKAEVGNYWLFPVIVDNPYEVMKALEKEGIEAYEGATQLRTVHRTQGKDVATSCTVTTDEGGLTNNHMPRRDELIHPQLNTGPELAAGISQPVLGEHSYKLGRVSQQSFSMGSDTVEYAYSAIPLEKRELHLQEPVTAQCNKLPSISKKSHKDILYPYNAEYLIDHVLYLPVHKKVPLWYLECICNAMEKVMKDRVGVRFKNGKNDVIFPSKL